MTVLLIIAWLLLGLSAAGITLWIIVAVRITIAMRDRSSVREGLDLPAPEGGWPALSIVVPAHNEQRVIDTCASLLRGQDYDNLQSSLITANLYTPTDGWEGPAPIEERYQSLDGTNFAYIYPRRVVGDAPSYYLEETGNLVFGPWSNEEVNKNYTIDVGAAGSWSTNDRPNFAAVTNMIPTDLDAKFIQLIIEE